MRTKMITIPKRGKESPSIGLGLAIAAQLPGCKQVEQKALWNIQAGEGLPLPGLWKSIIKVVPIVWVEENWAELKKGLSDGWSFDKK
jgi:hypothetical protein